MHVTIYLTFPLRSFQSHGREKLEGDKLDYSKGSFYANPLTENLAESMLERRRHVCMDSNRKELLNWDESLQSIHTDDEF